MTAALAALLTLIPTQQPQQGNGDQFLATMSVILDGKGNPTNLMYSVSNEKRIGGPKLSPMAIGTPPRRLEFDWLTTGWVEGLVNEGQQDLRFRVYSQGRVPVKDPAPYVARMLLRLWSIVHDEYGIDHSPLYNGGLVDVYLCELGKPGGEQRFDVDDQQKPPAKVNTIYIYDVNTFTEPVEMAREVAHEYGHAMLYAVGGFKMPEDWASGYLGEKIFLRNLSRRLAAGDIYPGDVMDASKEGLADWVGKNVDPISDAIALKGPRYDLGKTRGKAAMDAYIGTALWVEEAYGPKVFARSGRLNAEMTAKGYLETVLLAASEPDRITVNIPARLAGKAVYLPVGKAKVEGAKELYRKDGWAKVQPTGGALTLINR